MTDLNLNSKLTDSSLIVILGRLESIALEAVGTSHQISMRYFETPPAIEVKRDHTLVSEADRNIEKCIASYLAKETPSIPFIGEETGQSADNIDLLKGTYWLLDPIDGTINFLSRIPLWSTLLALIVDGEPVLGIVSLPSLDEVFIASRGNGARWGRFSNRDDLKPCFVSPKQDLSGSIISLSTFTTFSHRNLKFSASDWAQYEIRTHSDAFGYTRILNGGVQAMIDPIVAPYDVAALQVLFDETPQAYFTSLHGHVGALRYRAGSCVAGVSHEICTHVIEKICATETHNTKNDSNIFTLHRFSEDFAQPHRVFTGQAHGHFTKDLIQCVEDFSFKNTNKHMDIVITADCQSKLKLSANIKIYEQQACMAYSFEFDTPMAFKTKFLEQRDKYPMTGTDTNEYFDQSNNTCHEGNIEWADLSLPSRHTMEISTAGKRLTKSVLL